MNKKIFKIVSSEHFWDQKSGKFYLGIDPTGIGLHIGHLIPIKMCLELLNNGFSGILLIGGFTGGIGDPTDKNEARKKLEEESTNNYSKCLFDDIARIFEPYKDQIIMVNNKTWLENFSLKDYLSVAYHISINKKLHMDTFEKRIGNNLNLSGAEFLYPDLQMIDFLYLYNTYGCNIQIGGQDQWGNISYGVHCVQKITQNDNIFGLSTPLLTSNNKKISKTEGKPAFIKDPFAIYQFCIRLTDDTLEQMRDIFAPNLIFDNDTQKSRKNICKEVFKIGYPQNYEDIFKNTEEIATAMFYQDINEINEDLLTPCESSDIISLINKMDSTLSKSEIKRKLTEGAISINDNKINENINLTQGKFKIKIGSKTVFCIYIE